VLNRRTSSKTKVVRNRKRYLPRIGVLNQQLEKCSKEEWYGKARTVFANLELLPLAGRKLCKWWAPHQLLLFTHRPVVGLTLQPLERQEVHLSGPAVQLAHRGSVQRTHFLPPTRAR